MPHMLQSVALSEGMVDCWQMCVHKRYSVGIKV